MPIAPVSMNFDSAAPLVPVGCRRRRARGCCRVRVRCSSRVTGHRWRRLQAAGHGDLLVRARRALGAVSVAAGVARASAPSSAPAFPPSRSSRSPRMFLSRWSVSSFLQCADTMLQHRDPPDSPFVYPNRRQLMRTASKNTTVQRATNSGTVPAESTNGGAMGPLRELLAADQRQSARVLLSPGSRTYPSRPSTHASSSTTRACWHTTLRSPPTRTSTGRLPPTSARCSIILSPTRPSFTTAQMMETAGAQCLLLAGFFEDADARASQHPLVRGARREFLRPGRGARTIAAQGTAARHDRPTIRAVAPVPRATEPRAARSAVLLMRPARPDIAVVKALVVGRAQPVARPPEAAATPARSLHRVQLEAALSSSFAGPCRRTATRPGRRSR